MRQVTALFGVVCLVGSVLAAVFAVFMLTTGGSGPVFGTESPAGQSVTVIRPTTLWAKPASLQLSAVTCTADEFGGTRKARLPLGKPPDGKATEESSRHGTLRYLTRTSTAGFTVGSVTCSGSGLSGIVTARDSGAIHHGAGVGLLIGAPILLLLGLGIRRAGFRVSA